MSISQNPQGFKLITCTINPNLWATTSPQNHLIRYTTWMDSTWYQIQGKQNYSNLHHTKTNSYKIKSTDTETHNTSSEIHAYLTSIIIWSWKRSGDSVQRGFLKRDVNRRSVWVPQFSQSRGLGQKITFLLYIVHIYIYIYICTKSWLKILTFLLYIVHIYIYIYTY